MTTKLDTLVWLGLLLIAFSPIANGGESLPEIGSKVGDFELVKVPTGSARLSDWKDARAIVVIAVGTECPLAKLYAGRLQELADRYADRGVQFLALSSNSQDTLSELSLLASSHKIEVPILKDPNAAIADRLGITRTPEAVVLDSARTIRYRGRIDDQYGIGVNRKQPVHNYLTDALDAVLTDRPVVESQVEVVGCLIGRPPASTEEASATFARDVAPILEQHCVACHHRGDIGPFSLSDYDSAAPWSDMIAEVVAENRMPPWHATNPHTSQTGWEGTKLDFVASIDYANARGLTPDEKQTLIRWADAGAPRGKMSGNAVDASPKSQTKGWHLPAAPDAEFTMASKPYTVPAEGAVKYQYFSVDPQWKEDRWISASEVLPGNRAVVHHVLVFAKEPGSRGLGGGEHGFLAAYVPGLKPAVYPPGMAKRIPAGSQLVFQVHYTPIGSAQNDLTRVGFLFADPAKITHRIETHSAVNRRFSIQPELANQKFEAADTIPYSDSLLVAMMPHMHVRGQAFRYSLVSGNESKTLLEIPAYDFNWQTGYELSQPLPLQRGDRIEVVGWFNNSKENPANPDPTATVHWGDQTWEEMLIGYYDLAVPHQRATSVNTPADPDASSKAQDSDRTQNLLERLDRNRDGKISLEETPAKSRPLHSRLDRNADGLVDVEELRALDKFLGSP